MTRAQLLADYLGVTFKKYPGLYVSGFVGGQHGAARIRTTLTHRVPGDPDLAPEEQAAWLLAMVEHKAFGGLTLECGFFALWVCGWPSGANAPTPDAACLAALLAADREFAAKWEAAG